MKKIITRTTKYFNEGVKNVLDDTLINEGAASDSMNFVTLPDRIELILGRRLLGEEAEGNDQVLGAGEILKEDGTKLLLRKVGTSLEYFDTETQTWEESKTGLLDGEKMYFSSSFTPAGRQIWACGQDGLFKIYPSNPETVLDLTDPLKNYKGRIEIVRSRMLCWGMKEDPTGLRFSRVDTDSNYNLVSGEAVGVAGSTTYEDTLALGEVFGVVFTDGTQTVTDDKNGKLEGDGTGTINYATGEYSVEFDSVATSDVTVSYVYENSLDKGLADFTSSATRLAGEGNVIRQDSLGSITHGVFVFGDVFYSLQDKGSWTVRVSTDDLTFDNQIYRSSIACPSYLGGVVTADGIVFVDTFNSDYPKLRLLRFNQLGDKVVPEDLSREFKMEDYTFDEDTAMWKKKDWVLISCKRNSTRNNVILIYNLIQKSFDVVNYTSNVFLELENKIIAGDSLSPNMYELFTGRDDLDFEIEAFWEGKRSDLKIEDLKKYKRERIGGFIEESQSFDILASYDNDSFEYVGSVSGTGNYVDKENSIAIGSSIVGADVLGGESDAVANYFMTEIRVRTPKFLTRKLRFVPTGIGT